MMRRIAFFFLGFVAFTFSGLSATNSLVAGQNVLGRIGAVGQTNYYEFAVTSNQVITAFLSQSNATAGYPMIDLYAPDGSFIASEAGNVYAFATLLERHLAEGGTYQLRIHDDGSNELFDYGLTLLQGPGFNLGAQQIAPGETVSGTINSTAEINVWTFNATSNQMITAFLSQANPTAGYPVLELYAPDGSFMDFAAGNAYGIATFLERRVTQSGVFQLRVRDDGGNELFGYGLTLLQAPGFNLGDGPIQPGETVSGSIAAAAAIRTWTFAGSSNQVISAFLGQPNPIAGYPVVELYGPSGDRIDSEAGNRYGIASFLEQRLTETGTYQLRVRDDGGNEIFDFGLTLLQSPGANLGEQAIQLGETVTGAITAAAQMQVWTFTAASNQWITALLSQVTPLAGYPVIDVYGPDGSFVASATGNTGALLEHHLIATGNYQLRVHDDGGNELFDYSVTLVAIPGANPGDEGGGVLAPGVTLTNDFVLADLDVFTFPAVAGDSVWLSLSKVGEETGANPFMDLFAPDGTRVASGAVINRRCLTRTGDYFLIVRDDGGNETYSYALSLAQSPLPPPGWDFDHPYLSIFRCGGQTVVRWPAAIAPSDLEFTSDLSSSIWLSINPPYFESAGYYYHTNIATDPARFYRLHGR